MSNSIPWDAYKRIAEAGIATAFSEGETERTFTREQLTETLMLTCQEVISVLTHDYIDHPKDWPSCPICQRPTKQTYMVAITRSSLVCLAELIELCVGQKHAWVKLWQHGGGYDLPNGEKHQSEVPEARKRIQEAVWFGLVERVDGKGSNQYRPTKNAMDFLNGKEEIRAYLRVLSGKPLEASEEMINVDEVQDWPQDRISHAVRMCHLGHDLETVYLDDIPIARIIEEEPEPEEEIEEVPVFNPMEMMLSKLSGFASGPRFKV